MGRRACLCLEAPWVGRDCLPWAHHSLALLTWCLAHSPTLPLPGWPSPPLCQGPCPLSLPQRPHRRTVAQVRRAGETGTERRPFSCHPWGSGLGLRWGLAKVKMAPWFPCGRVGGGGAGRCLLFPEGRDRIWPGVLLAWLEAAELPAACWGARPALGPHSDRTHPCKAQGRGQPQGCPASPAAHIFTPGQASSGTGRQSRGQPGKALLPAWAAAGSQQKTKAGFSPGLEALVEEGAGPGGCHPESGCTPVGAQRSWARAPRSDLGMLSLCVPTTAAGWELVPFQAIRLNRFCLPNLGW